MNYIETVNLHRLKQDIMKKQQTLNRMLQDSKLSDIDVLQKSIELDKLIYRYHYLLKKTDTYSLETV
jgi:hypothetical protein